MIDISLKYRYSNANIRHRAKIMDVRMNASSKAQVEMAEIYQKEN